MSREGKEKLTVEGAVKAAAGGKLINLSSLEEANIAVYVLNSMMNIITHEVKNAEGEVESIEYPMVMQLRPADPQNPNPSQVVLDLQPLATFAANERTFDPLIFTSYVFRYNPDEQCRRIFMNRVQQIEQSKSMITKMPANVIPVVGGGRADN